MSFLYYLFLKFKINFFRWRWINYLLHYNFVNSVSRAILGDISKGTSSRKVRLTFHPYIQIYTVYCNLTCFNAFSTRRFSDIDHLSSGQLQKHWIETVFLCIIFRLWLNSRCDVQRFHYISTTKLSGSSSTNRVKLLGPHPSSLWTGFLGVPVLTGVTNTLLRGRFVPVITPWTVFQDGINEYYCAFYLFSFFLRAQTQVWWQILCCFVKVKDYSFSFYKLISVFNDSHVLFSYFVHTTFLYYL